ncbi:MAG: lysoplasmalogenase [Acidimicrobiia bacterium]|nr:lysoplasmalogenase [Acidimicrobiia bacterium]MDX2468297.1 lysoplasmalogenase [Acidimicrobiia bacterium]
MAWVFTIACLVGLGLLLHAEVRRPRQARLPKMVAATAFIAVAISVGALDTTFGKIMLVGLALSWFGDLFLSFNGRGPFVAGLAVFLAGQVAYVTAFSNRGLGEQLYVPVLAVIVIAIPVARWLLPTVPKELKGPVIAYMAVISAMVATAVSTNALSADWRIPVGAIAFYLSDLGVARERFAWPGMINRMAALPLYFGGQLLLAWAAGS